MLEQDTFLEKYKLKKIFTESGLSWDTLKDIYDDYCQKKSDLIVCRNNLEHYLLDGIDIPLHSMRLREKDPEHLIEKIIRKRGTEQNKKYDGIDVSNYREIVRDLVGGRILMLAKEEWEGIFDWIVSKFPADSGNVVYMAESPVAYTRYGDRDIFKDKIHTEHTNKGYRSQHYVVKFHGFYCELQTRTLSEEVYGEFDHKVKYPYRNSNKFLVRYTNTLSQLLDTVDEIISTCFQLGESGWEQCNQYYEKDEYVDWKRTYQKTATKVEDKRTSADSDQKIDIASYANNILLRKGR